MCIFSSCVHHQDKQDTWNKPRVRRTAADWYENCTLCASCACLSGPVASPLYAPRRRQYRLVCVVYALHFLCRPRLEVWLDFVWVTDHWSLRHFKLNCNGVVTSFCAPHLSHFVTPAKRTRTRLAPHCQWGGIYFFRGQLIALMKFPNQLTMMFLNQ